MNAQAKIDELIGYLASLTDVDQRRACLAQLDQLLVAEFPIPPERSPLLLTEAIGEATVESIFRAKKASVSFLRASTGRA
jgi:hypothetical protein